MMLIDNKFEIGQVVYLATDIDQFPRMVTSLIVSKTTISYRLSQGECETTHFDYEILSEKDVSLVTGGGVTQ